MHRFIDGEDRMQQTLLPNSLEDYVGEENPARVIEVFIDELDLAALGFAGMTPTATGRPVYHPSVGGHAAEAPLGRLVANTFVNGTRDTLHLNTRPLR
jgi:transposase